MKKAFQLLVIVLFLLPEMVCATARPENLIKVTKENNPDCVEYYDYKGEMYCSTQSMTSQIAVDKQILSGERQKINFDGREWKAAWANKSENVTTIEYIPEGQNIKNWNELVTSQFMPGMQKKIEPMAFVHAIVRQMERAGLKPRVRLLYRTPTQVIFEFSLRRPENLKQDEIQKIVKGDDGYYILHYAIKKSNMGKHNRKKWLKLLKSSQVIKK